MEDGISRRNDESVCKERKAWESVIKATLRFNGIDEDGASF